MVQLGLQVTSKKMKVTLPCPYQLVISFQSASHPHEQDEQMAVKPVEIKPGWQEWWGLRNSLLQGELTLAHTQQLAVPQAESQWLVPTLQPCGWAGMTSDQGL